MIKFVMVNPTIEPTNDYVKELVSKINLEYVTVKDCSIYSEGERESKARVDTVDGFLYFVEFDLSTYKEVKHLTIKIIPQRIKENSFDEILHKLKILIKDLIRGDWEDCVWLEDEQSRTFAEELYSKIYRIENSLRQFINLVMVRYFGTKWWDNFVPFEIVAKRQARVQAFKRVAPSFTNVNDHLLSVDTDDLIKIMTHEFKKWDPVHNKKIENSLRKNSLEQKELNALFMMLKGQMKPELAFWDKIFAKYFAEDFLQAWENFSKNRNHVAHNKLLDYEAYKVIKKHAELVQDMITNAKEGFEKASLSDEVKEMMDEFNEIEESNREKHLESLMESEAGIEIRNESEILSLFYESILEFISGLEDSLYFRQDIDFDIGEFNNSDRNVIMVIKSKVDSSHLEIKTKLSIDESRGETSELVMALYFNEERIGHCTLKHVNGDAVFSSELSYYVPTISDEYNDSELEEFGSLIFQKIDDCFPNLKEIADRQNYEVVKNGASPYVADFSCEECGESYVSIDESFFEVGKCVNCGQEHEVASCKRCETVYNPNQEGRRGFCENCNDYFKSS